MAAIEYGCYQLAVYASNQIDGIDVEAPEKEFEERISSKEKRKKTPVRTEPKNLEEQLAMEEAKNNLGKPIPKDKLVIKDPRYPEEDWSKKQHRHVGIDGTAINVHYWENIHTGERHGFKFKDPENK